VIQDDEEENADSGDDEAELMAELQKIKKERAAEIARKVSMLFFASSRDNWHSFTNRCYCNINNNIISMFAFPFCQKVVISEVMAVWVSACHYCLGDRSLTGSGSLVWTVEYVAF